MNCCCEFGIKKSLDTLAYFKYMGFIDNIDLIYFGTSYLQSGTTSNLQIVTSEYCKLLHLQDIIDIANIKDYYIPINYISLIKVSQNSIDTSKISSVDNTIRQKYDSLFSIKVPKSDNCCAKSDIICYLKSKYIRELNFKVQFYVDIIADNQLIPSAGGDIIGIDCDVIYIRTVEDGASNLYIVPICNITGIK